MRRAGFTVVELLVAMAVSTVVLTGVYRLMASGAHLFGRVQARSDMQDQGLMALSHLAADIRSSSWSMLTIRPADSQGPAAISLAALGNGAVPVPVTVYYLDTARQCLMRGQTTSSTPTRLDNKQLAASIPGLTNVTVMAGHVASMEVTPATLPSLVPQVEAVHATLWLGPATAPATLEAISMAAAPRT